MIVIREKGLEMVRRSLLLLAIVILCGGVAQAEVDFGRYHALVIGINDYQHLPRLETAVNDATAVADLLRQKYGFEVTLLLNPTRDRMVRTLDELRRTLTERDNLLIYYAGHGILDRETETGFWLPVDAEEGTEANWIDLPSVTRRAKAISAKHIMVVADSCYSGTLVRAAPSGIKSGAERLAELQRLAEKRSRTALVSGGLEPVADSGGYGHSVFARAFLTALRENEDVLQGQELFSAIRGPVVLNADQTPEYSDIRLTGHDGGDFLFVPVNVSIGAETEEQPAPAEDQRSIELALWDSVKGSTNPAALRAYLEAYPGGTFAALAKVQITELEADEARRDEEATAAQERELWETVKESTNPAVLRAYLESYPEGAYAALAKVRITELETAAAQRTEETAAARERALWESVKGSSNPVTLKTYLAEYPNGAFAELAKARITELEALAEQAEREARAEQQVALATPATEPSPSTSLAPGERNGEWRAKDGPWSVILKIDGSSVEGELMHSRFPGRIEGTLDADGRFSGSVPYSGQEIDRFLSGVFPEFKVSKGEWARAAKFRLERVRSSSQSPTSADRNGAWTAEDGNASMDVIIDGSTVKGIYTERGHKLRLKGKIKADGRFSGKVTIQSFAAKLSGVFPDLVVKSTSIIKGGTYRLERVREAADE